MKNALAFAVAGMIFVSAAATAAFAASKANRVSISYVLPKNPAHQPIYAGLKENDLTFEWLEKAYEERSEWLTWLKVDPKLDSIRSAPRFQNLMQRVGFELE